MTHRPGAGGPQVQAGTEFAGRYVLEELLGGGMGTVWRGTDRQLDRPVAVKVMRDRIADPQLAVRLQREARIAARLQHYRGPGGPERGHGSVCSHG